MKMLLKSLSFVGLLAATVSHSAAPAAMDINVDSVETRCLNCAVEESKVSPEDYFSPLLSTFAAIAKPAPSLPSTLEVIPLVKIGKEVWKLVEANKPVAQMTTSQVSVLPSRTLDWSQLTNWNVPTSREYQVLFKNQMGQTLIDFNYQILFTTGGRYQNEGAYLSHVTVVPSHLSVVWGANMQAEASVPNIVNLGTTENPIAGAEIHVKWHIKNVFQDMQATKVYFVNGLGEFKTLN